MLEMSLLAFSALAICMVIQVAAVVVMLTGLRRHMIRGTFGSGMLRDSGILISVLCVLFAGHIVQIAIWALIFFRLGEFGDYATAFYHSTVNFATLGYGDIVMSERWRLLGALQAASGVLMFGLSTSTLFSVMSYMFQRSKYTPNEQTG